MTRITPEGPPQTGRSDRSHRESIAIIGIGCRFPGGVNGPDAFWNLLRRGDDAITEIPADRTAFDGTYDPVPKTPGKIATRQGGFLDDIDRFDPEFFGIAPREAEVLDPQQRLLLEIAWEGLEDAGQLPPALAGSRTGVFIGMWTNEYEDSMFAATDDINLYMTTGGGRYAASGRLSYFFDFRGPSLTIDTACSSSLVAVHLACRSLWSGESSLALAGGVNLLLQPQISIGYSRSGMLSPDARCKFGDTRANGYVRSEAAGLVVLKPLSRALADQDPIYALIRGSAVNNDGRSSSLLVSPGVESQAAMLQEAYQDAGVPPEKVGYVEAHGTGTVRGDPVELQALGTILGQNRPPDRPCAIGSVKGNLGHTEAAAGIAGLIKTALCLKHRTIPATLHHQEPNPGVPWSELSLVMQTEVGPWPTDGPALAGVNAFGITGTNAHVVLQEPPPRTGNEEERAAPERVAHLLPLSAHTPAALKELAATYLARLDQAPVKPLPAIHDLCYTAAARRCHHDYRFACVVDSYDTLRERLALFLEEDDPPPEEQNKLQAPPRIVFVFSGQGGQWIGMGRQLLEQEPCFRETLEACEAAFHPYVSWSLFDQLRAPESTGRLDEIDVVQPLLFAIQVALAALWRARGIEPHAVVGHSLGEVAAAHVAGALSLEDAARVICRRSQLMKQLSGKGAMAVINLPPVELQQALATEADRLSIAVNNSLRSTVVSGEPAALDHLIRVLEKQAIDCRRIKVDVAAHSPQMEVLRPQLVADLDDLRPREAAIPIYSTVTTQARPGEQFDAAYWGRNLREPVRFAATVQQTLADGYNAFIEINPHPILLPAIEQDLADREGRPFTLPSMKREMPEQTVLLESLAALYEQGHPVDWDRFYPSGGRCVPLPSYPWQRERFWFDGQTGAQRPRRPSTAGGQSLLGAPLQSAAHGDTTFWECDISADTLPFLQDHQVREAVILPAALHLAMALDAATEMFGERDLILEDFTIREALFLPEAGALSLQLILETERPGYGTCNLFSRPVTDSAPRAAWTNAAGGKIKPARSQNGSPPALVLDEIRQRCRETVEQADCYSTLHARGLRYGPRFQSLLQLWKGTAETLARVHLPELAATEGPAFRLHPVLADACFQLLVATIPETGDTYLPVSLGSLHLHRQPDPASELWAYASLQGSEDSADRYTGDLLLLDHEGQAIMEVRSLTLQRVVPAPETMAGQLYELQWQAAPAPENPSSEKETGYWLIAADSDGIGEKLAALLTARGDVCLLARPGKAFKPLGARHVALDIASPDAFRTWLDRYGSDEPATCRGVIHLWSLDSAPAEQTTISTLDRAQQLGSGSALHLVQALVAREWEETPRLWLVTAGAQAVVEEDKQISISQAPLWGLGGVIAHEHPELRCTLVDLGNRPDTAEIQALCETLLADGSEDRIALRANRRYVARARHYEPKDTAPARSSIPTEGADQEDPPSFEVVIPDPGRLDSLALYTSDRRPPGPGEVEIRVHSAALNFIDVMKALGIYPGLEPDESPPLGLECAGRIVTVGDGIETLRAGDPVMAIAPSRQHGLFRSFATVPARCVVPIPAHLSFEEAAAIPIVFLTAYYGLHHLGRLRRGERVLIHSATGGVGLAAVQLAKLAGAEIFATAGSPAKREFLHTLGIRHVMDSRTLAFGDEIMERTGGHGVDLVLNSLTGDAIRTSLSVLARHGRFVEIGKRDIYQNSSLGLAPFKRNLSFFAVDLLQLIEDRPALVRSLLDDLMEQFQARHLAPPPIQRFPVASVTDAFRTMAQAEHMGKIVLALAGEVAPISAAPEGRIRPNHTYLVTGGLGGLGLEVARWMAEQGATHLALLARSGATAETLPALEALAATGVQVKILQADVAEESEMAAALAEIAATMPPLRGIIHAAGLLDDAALLQLDFERFRSVARPKIAGSWNLHRLAGTLPLDFFVLFSSVASFLGTAGQGNYAAANAFLDALVHHRRNQGQSALAINWGPWAEVGLAARRQRMNRLALPGIGTISPAQGIRALQQLIQEDATRVAVVALDPQRWCEAYPADTGTSLLAGFLTESGSAQRTATGDARKAIRALEGWRQQQAWLERFLQKEVARILKLAPSRIDPHKPLRTMGLDSLMTIELRNRIENAFGLSLSAAVIWNYPTVAALIPYLAGKLGLSVESREPAPGNAPADPAPHLAGLSQAEVEAELARELASLDELLGIDQESDRSST